MDLNICIYNGVDLVWSPFWEVCVLGEASILHGDGQGGHFVSFRFEDFFIFLILTSHEL